MNRPWNDKLDQRIFWDTSANGGQGSEFIVVQSLKDSLKNYSGMKFEDMLRSVAEGLVMVMDVIEQNDNKGGSVKTDPNAYFNKQLAMEKK